MRSSHSPWRDLAALHAESFTSLLVPGVIVHTRRAADRRGVAIPELDSPFEESGVCLCGSPQVRLAQFWEGGRLWQLRTCYEAECERVDVLSAPASETLPEGSPIEGDSDWTVTPWMFLLTPDTPQWSSHPVIQDLAGALEADDGWGFHQALAEQLGAFVSETYPIGCPSRVGGVGEFIQWEHTPTCPTCSQTMPLLVQLGGDADFYWADAGVLYVFACAQHPDQVRVFRDTH